MDSINKIIIFSTRFLGRLWQIWLEDQGKISWRRWAAATDETASKRWRTCHYHCRLHDRSSRIVTSSVPLRRWDKSGYGQYKWATRVRTYRTNYEQRKQSAVFLGHAQGKTNKGKITIKLRTICDFFIYFFFFFSAFAKFGLRRWRHSTLCLQWFVRTAIIHIRYQTLLWETHEERSRPAAKYSMISVLVLVNSEFYFYNVFISIPYQSELIRKYWE